MDKSNGDHVEKHFIHVQDERQDVRQDERSSYVTKLLESCKERWPSSFKDVHELRTSICVSEAT